MKSKSLIKSNTLSLVFLVLIAMIACRLDIQENINVREFNGQSEIEIVSNIEDVDSKQPSFCYFAFFQKNIHNQLIVNLFYDHVLKYHDRINFQTFKNQKHIELSTDTKKSLLFYFSQIHFDTEYPEIIS